MGWWVTGVLNQPNGQVILVSWIVWVVLSITLHELAHGWAAIYEGDETPRELGHMTPNPLVHMGLFSFVALAVIGIAWGQMPVNPDRMRRRYSDALVAVAGPAMNLALAVLATLLLWAWAAAGPSVTSNPVLQTNMREFLAIGVWLNIILMIFNLAPAPPLDGSRIIASFNAGYRRLFFESENGRWLGLGLFVIVFITADDLLFPLGSFISGTMIGLVN